MRIEEEREKKTVVDVKPKIHWSHTSSKDERVVKMV
jgi:hypothetical protein